MLTALQRLTGDFESAIYEAGKLLAVRGAVIPVTLSKTTLNAELQNGTIVRGETNIDIPTHGRDSPIRRVWLAPQAFLNPRAKKAISEADAVIVGPGDLYTSLIPNLLIKGMSNALQKTRAKIIYMVNVMTKFGETNGFAASDFLRVIEEYIAPGTIDYVVANNRRPTPTRLRPYAGEKAQFVVFDIAGSSKRPIPIVADLLRARGFLRHDSEKVAQLIRMIV